MVHAGRVSGLFALVFAALACSCSREQPLASTARSAGTPLEGRISAPDQDEDGQWTMAAKDYANTRFSSLNEINTGNISRLRVA
jgi:glucose dehydrogenase